MATNSVKTISLLNKPELKQFVQLERKLIGSHPHYISEIDNDVVKVLSGKSALFPEGEVCLFVASKAGQDIARCAAMIDKTYQANKKEAVGFIGYFAAAPDCNMEVSEMISQAEQWLKERGVTRIIAPCNGAAPQPAGFLCSDYDKSPMFPFPWHPPYYKDYIEALKYQLTYPQWYYEIDFSTDKYKNAKLQVSNNDLVKVRSINKKNWDKDLETIRQLFEETFIDEWEFCGLSSPKIHEFFDPMKPIIDARQILIAEIDGQPCGFCIALPDLTPLFRSFKGKVGLIQIFKLLTRAKKYSRAGLLAIGVGSGFKGKGVAKSLAIKLYERHEELGMKKSLYFPVNEVNTPSRRFAESLGGVGKVMYHCYDKNLS